MDEDTGKRTKVLKYGRTRREALLALLGAGAGLGAGLALAPIVSAPITNPPTIGRLSSDFLSLIPRSTRPAGIPSSSMWVRDTGDLMLYDGADDVLVGPGAGAPSDASYVRMASEGELSAESVLGTGVIMAGTTASRPSAGVNGRLFWSTDEGILYRDNASVWQKSAVRDYADLDAKPIGVIEVFNVGDYGTFSAAVAAATAAGSGTIHVPVGTWPVTTNETRSEER